MNEKNEMKDTTMYKRAKSAKGSVRSVLEHLDPFSDPDVLLNYVFDRFSPDERVVIGAGGFTVGQDGNLQFLMPSTARVIRYFKNGIDRYEKGYTKITVSSLKQSADNYRHFVTDKFEKFSERMIEERRAKEQEEEERINEAVQETMLKVDSSNFDDVDEDEYEA